jgi:DNA-directed RNA polymerase specialized sigma24 family protein
LTTLDGNRVDDDVFKLLQAADWEAIGMELAAYVVHRARNLSWRTGARLDPDSHLSIADTARDLELAMGLNPIDIAQQAIKKVLDGGRMWEPTRGPLLPYLKGVVDSLVNHLADSLDNQLQRRIPESEEDEDLSDHAEFRASLNDVHDLGAIAGVRPLDPELALLHKESDDVRVAKLFEQVAVNRELEDVLTAIMEVGPKPSDIAEHLEVSTSEINNRLKRLRRLALRPIPLSHETPDKLREDPK